MTKTSSGFGATNSDWTGIESTYTPVEGYGNGWWGIYPPYYEICWYRLPCGDCSRTGGPCKHGGAYKMYTTTSTEYTTNTTTTNNTTTDDTKTEG